MLMGAVMLDMPFAPPALLSHGLFSLRLSGPQATTKNKMKKMWTRVLLKLHNQSVG